MFEDRSLRGADKDSPKSNLPEDLEIGQASNGGTLIQPLASYNGD